MVMSFRLRRTLETYDIEALVQSRFLSGIIDINVPTYQLSLPPRDNPQYWSHKTTDGSRHGASWQNINWQRRPIDEKMIQVHFSDRIKFPEASINFADLVHYLGDLGLQTNPEGFWDLSQKGLNVLPGTCLVREIGENNVEKPILVVAKPTVEHPGTLLLRFQNNPRMALRTDKDLEPDWISVPAVPEMTESDENKDNNGIQAATSSDSLQVNETSELTRNKLDEKELEKIQQEMVKYVRINRKGFLEKKLMSGATLAVVGLPYWFVYAMLASTAQKGHHEYNGRPFGYKFRLEYLYFSREVAFALGGAPGGRDAAFHDWKEFLSEILNATKVNAIPYEWTEDSPARKDIHLTKRFELLIDPKLRNRAAELRRPRQKSFQVVNEIEVKQIQIQHLGRQVETGNAYIPFEVFSISTASWSKAARYYVHQIYPLTANRVPTSQEICLAAMSNVDLATQVADTIGRFYKWFLGEAEAPDLLLRQDIEGHKYYQVILMCAIIIIQSIADGAPYLAALMDVERCITKWDPVYLC
jgi:hypothetical protein